MFSSLFIHNTGKSNSKWSWQGLAVSITFVLNKFMKDLLGLMTKNRERMSDTFSGHTSKPSNNIGLGIHLLLITCMATRKRFAAEVSYSPLGSWHFYPYICRPMHASRCVLPCNIRCAVIKRTVAFTIIVKSVLRWTFVFVLFPVMWIIACTWIENRRYLVIMC